MIAEIITEAYDPLGKKTLNPDLRRKGVHPTHPMGRYVSQPLMIRCESIRDIRKFLGLQSGFRRGTVRQGGLLAATRTL